MNFKKHYKLYKKGKNWCVMALSCAIVSLGLMGVANADDVQTTIDNSATPSSQMAQGSDVNVLTQENKETTGETDDSKGTLNKESDDQPLAQPEKVVQPKASGDESKPLEQLNGWHQDQNTKQWTYYTNGQTAQGRNYVNLPTINGQGNNWYLVENGTVLSGVQQWAGTYYYFDPQTYLRVDNNYVQSKWGDWYMFGQDGRIATKVYQWAGTYYYFDPQTYLRVDNNYVQSQWGLWYMFGQDGRIATKVYQWAGTYYYFDPSTYLRVNHNYVQSQWGDWYMFGNDGRIVSGLYDWMGSTYYFDPTTYLKAEHDFTLGHANYFVDPSGIITGVNLNAPYINQYQVGDMACEATSLLEALHGKGYAQNYDIQSFIKTMPISKNGNPNEGFGGGYQNVTPGTFQSIYPAPLAKWGSNFGKVQNISGSTPVQIRQQLINGNPVVVYVTMHWAAPQYGRYWWGTGVNNSHVMTVDGYRNGQYHVEDPAGGSYWVSAQNFESAYNIKRFAVVVY